MVKVSLRNGLMCGIAVVWVFSSVAQTPEETTPSSEIVVPESPAPDLSQGDPTGVKTGTAAQITKANPEAPSTTLLDVANEVGHNKIAINFVWTLLAGVLVMFMQAGFAMVETGLCRVKNAMHTMAMNMVVYALGVLGFYICGFAIMFGGAGNVITALSGGIPALGTYDNKWFGHTGFFLSGTAYDVSVFTLFLFQVVFMDTAATIPTGAMAERWKWTSFVLWGFFISMFLYPVYGHWVWGGGWLADLGYWDFAGSSVVHAIGGWAGLAGAINLGPRRGKFDAKGKPQALVGHNIPMAVVGAYILAFGWFGFNAGSTLAGTDLRIGVVAVNTMLASCTGMLGAMFYMWLTTKKPDPTMTVNGFLAGLVAITAPCAFVNALSAAIIGLVAGVLVCVAYFFGERVLKVDDPVGAWAVHGVNGLFGVLCIGLFADGSYLNVKGLFYGNAKQLVIQALGGAVAAIWAFVVASIWFQISGLLVGGNRVDEEIEVSGLDLPEMGVEAYTGFVRSPELP